MSRRAPLSAISNRGPLLVLADLMPADTPEYMRPAWLGCLSWAISERAIVTAFRADTGLFWRPPTTALDRLIDAASGADRHFVEAFIRWANVNVWGSIGQPEAADAVDPHADSDTGTLSTRV